MAGDAPLTDDMVAAMQGRILARPFLSPGAPARMDSADSSEAPGLYALSLSGEEREESRDGLLYVPPDLDVTRPAPCVLLLHGASHTADTVLAPLLPLADAAGLILLAPNARLYTWDVILGGYGPDVAVINRALALIFARFTVDTSRLAIGGFSDGASYALSLGLTNGDLFTHIIAFSPGFMAPGERRGHLPVYVSHGVHDEILPVDRCSRHIVRALQQAGYDVDYHEFDGPHTVPPEIAGAAVAWLMR